MFTVTWRHFWMGVIGIPVGLLFGSWIGFFNVGASSGHWAITETFLEFAMRSAVRTYSLAEDVPETFDAEMLQPSAGHYARGCAYCHGAPGEPRTPVVKQMLPYPPDLTLAAPTWGDAELFRIVKHGVRFAGMPAWPTLERDDEVWGMVAFLRELPTLDAARYRSLAFGDEAAAPADRSPFERALGECARCHGADGLGRSAAVPAIAGQSEAYLIQTLDAYLDEQRASGIMALAASLPDAGLLDDLARHFAALPGPFAGQAAPRAANGSADSSLVERGRAIAENGIPERFVPRCLGCHEIAQQNPAFPRIAGQKAHYIATQLSLFHAGTRGGGNYAHLMTQAAKGLEPADIEALAAYFAGR